MSSALTAFSNDLASAVERAGRFVVAVHARPRTPSSGIVWKPGVVVTTHHTTERDEEITLGLPGGRTVAATLAGRDPSTDLAVLRFENGNLEPAATTSGEHLKPGHLALAVGRGPSVSLGVIRSASGPLRPRQGGSLDRFWHLDVTIYYGFSGGALVTAEGLVAGLNTSAIARGMAASIPTPIVDRVADEILRTGHIRRGYLGLGMQPVRLPEPLARSLHLDSPAGLIVLSVEPEAPAGQAGFLVGDVLLWMDGVRVTDTDDVQAVLDPSRVGKSVPAVLLRAGARVELAVRIGERPKEFA